MSLQSVQAAARPQEVQESYWQTCSVTFHQTVETIYNYVTQILKIFYLLGYMLYAGCWEGRDFSALGGREADANFSRVFRRIVQDPIGQIDQVIDPALNPQHFQASIGENLAIPAAPAIDTAVLNRLFDELINVTDPQSPNYIDPSTIVDDPDAPATYAQLKEGLPKFLAWIGEHQSYSTELPNMLRHITLELVKVENPHPPHVRRECLLDLARAGFRHCPTLMNGRTQVWYEILKGEVETKTLPEKILSILHDFRRDTLYNKMSGQDVHYYQEYLVSIGTHLGIKMAAVADNDDPYLMITLAPKYSLPAFFREYTPQAIVNVLSLALNGVARNPAHPWERTGRKINFAETQAWLQEQLPEGGTVQDYLDPQAGTLTREGVIFILQRLQVFNNNRNIA